MFSSADEELCTDPKGRRTEREREQMRVVRGEKAREKRGRRGVPVLRCNVAPLLSQ